LRLGKSRGTTENALEGGHSEDETLERTVLNTVPGVGRVLGRLLTVELLNLSGTEAEEVDELRGESGLVRFEGKRQENERTSAAASISPCHAFLPCPSMVAAQILARYLPAMRSAA
jgi:hypothetical protein